MLISFFKQNQQGPLFVLIPIMAVFLWLPGLLNLSPIIIPSRPMPLYDFFVALLQGINFLSTAFALLLVIVGAFIINRIVNNFDVLPSSTNLPALMYIVLMSSFIELQTLHPVIFSNLLILLVLDRIANMYLQKTVFSQAFDAGTIAAVASFFYFPSIIFFLFIWISLLIIRPLKWREYIISFFGLLLPYIFLVIWYFITNQFSDFKQKRIEDLNTANVILPSFEAIDYLVSVSLLVVLGLSVLNIPSLLGKRNVRVQSLIKCVFALLIIAILGVFADDSQHPYSITQAAIPTAILFSGLFYNIPKKWLSETIFLILLGLITFNLLVH
jgi:hypothetical protein